MFILFCLKIKLNISQDILSISSPTFFSSWLSLIICIHKHNSKNGRPLIIHVSRLVSYSLCELRRENFRGIKCQKNANTECRTGWNPFWIFSSKIMILDFCTIHLCTFITTLQCFIQWLHIYKIQWEEIQFW